jgi:uncharacterized damage-inducible protein DinB
MKRRQLIPALAASPLLAQPASTWNNPFVKSWHDSFTMHWRDTRDYTLAVIEAMPPEGFTLKPNPEQRTFGEQMIHLAQANNAYFRGFGILPPPQITADAADKDSVRKFVAASFDYTSTVLSRLTEKDMLRTDVKLFQRGQAHSGTDICMRAYMHTAHHRGQCVVYLRVKGIKPPAWKFEPTVG